MWDIDGEPYYYVESHVNSESSLCILLSVDFYALRIANTIAMLVDNSILDVDMNEYLVVGYKILDIR